MADMAKALGNLAGELFKAGASNLGTIVGTAIGGPVGGIAGKVVDTLAEALGTAKTPEAVADAIPTKPEVVAEIEAQSPELVKVWQVEADRAGGAQDAEIEKGFGAWQFWRGAWQALVVGGSAVILLTALFGGGWVKPLIPMTEVIGWWGSITMTWLAVFNGGHTLKEIAPMLKFGRR